jgi:hypothetical protein
MDLLEGVRETRVGVSGEVPPCRVRVMPHTDAMREGAETKPPGP